MTTTRNLQHQIPKLITQLQIHIDEDRKGPSAISGRYNNIQEMLDSAKQQYDAGDLDAALETLGEINLDALDQVDEMDDTIGRVISQLHILAHYHRQQNKQIPTDIDSKLQELESLLTKYTKVSQTCP